MNSTQVIRVGTSERDGTFWSEGAAVAALIERDFQVPVEVIDPGHASVGNARALAENRIDIGFMASNWIGRAYRGEAPFDRPTEIRNVAPANSGAMFFITAADSPLLTVRDMIGRRVAIGPKESGMVQHIHTIFGQLGIGFGDFTPVYIGFEDGAAALENGEVDAQWQCPYPNTVMRELADRFPVRVLDYQPEDLATILRAVDFYRPETMPAGLFPGVDSASGQLAVVNIIAAHEQTDPEIVKTFVRAMLSNLDELAVINPLFEGLAGLIEPARSRGEDAILFGGVPLHSGAIDAYREAGYLT